MRTTWATARVVVPYVAIAGFWIVSSDLILDSLLPDHPQSLTWSMAKGLAFVLVTAALLHVLLRRELRARDRDQQALRASEARHRAMFENHHAPMLVVDPRDGAIVDANPAAERFYGWPRSRLLRMTGSELNDVGPQAHQEALQAAMRQERNVFQFRHRLASGELRDVDVYSGPIERDGRTLLLSIVHDAAERHRAERELQHMNRIFAMLSETNQLVVRATERAALFDGACRIAVEHGGFRFAWIGLLDADGAVQPVARAGDDGGYIDSIRASADASSERSRGPVGCALRSGAHAVANDFRTSAATRPWHEAAARAGVGAVAAFPLRAGGELIGVFALYAAEPGFFGAQELAVLDEMAVDVSFGLDMLERRLALEAATRVVEASPVVLFRWRAAPGWPVEFVSENVARWGYAPQALVSGAVDYRTIVHPDDRAWALRAVERCLADGTDEFIQRYRIVTAAGEVRWVEDNSSVERAADGRLIRLQGTVADITERRLAELALRENEALYRELFEANPHPMYVYDNATLRFLAVNNMAVEQYGYSRDEFLRMTLADIRPPEDMPRLLQQIAESGETPIRRSGVWRHRRRDGSEIEVEIRSHALTFAGRPARMVLAHDVTARLQAERALRASEQFSRAVLDSLTAHIAILDPSGRIVAVNRVWREFAARNGGRPEAVCEGARYLDVCDRARGDGAADARAFAAGIRRVLHGDLAEFDLEYACHSPGEKRWFIARISRFAGDGPLHIVVAHVDITERKRAAAAAIAQAERLAHYVAASPCVVYALAVRGDRFVSEWVSENVQSLLGYSAPEALAEGWWTHNLHPDDRAAALGSFAGLGEAGAHTHDYRFRKADGSWIWIQDQLRLLRDGKGRPSRVIGVWTDVTELRSAQQALAASEARYRATFEQAAVGVARLGLDGRWLDVNQRLCALTGYSRGELLACGYQDITHPDDVASDAEQKQRILDGEFGWGTLEKRYLRKDGRPIWVSRSVALVRTEAGAPDYFVSVIEDVSERRRAEASLRASEANLARAQRIAHLGSWELVLANNQLNWSDEVYRIFGVTPDEFIVSLQAALAAVHADDRDRVDRHLAHVLAGETTLDIEHRIRRPDGAVRWVHELAEVERDAAGKPMRLTGTVHDITERRRVEDELRRLSLAIEQSSESIVITDLKGRIEFVNDAFTRISGYRREELIGRNPRLLQSGRTPRETYDAMWRALAAGRTWQGEFFNRRKDGSEYVESALVSPLRQPDGSITSYVAVKEDITDKRRVAQELERYRHRLEERVAERTAQLAVAQRQAEAASQAKSEFLANMSHEIRTPMNGVLGMLEVLAQSRLTDQQADMVRTARDSGRTLLSLIDDILDFSKIEAGRLQIERQPVAVAHLVEGLCDALLPIAQGRDVDLGVFVAPDVPAQVMSDPLRLRQILFNLIGNAIKFSGGRGDRVGRVRVRVTVDGTAPTRLAFAIIDNGIGMSAETIERLFTPFSQAEASTTRRFGGTGLGLTICRRLAELMHGEIRVESQPEAGSTFTLLLPVEVTAEQPRQPLPDLAGIACVLVESPELDGDGLAAYLAHAGARVHRVPTAAAAVRQAARCAGIAVVLRHTAHAQAARVSALPRAPNLRHLLITRGRRRRPRVESPEVVSLDGAALRREALLRAVAIAAGRASPDAAPVAPPAAAAAPTPPTTAEARERGELILVAEDDAVNRKVILKQLELLGRAAEVAHDGAEALRLWQQGRYALLLTDLHMPQMDGYELAQAIRQQEAERPSGSITVRRLPIVALTANALRGEADRARAAGMDDFLVKPLRLDLLRSTLERWLPAARRRAAAGPPPRDAEPSAAIDVAVLKGLVGDDAATLREFLSYFAETSARTVAELRAASDASDATRAGSVAHRLKSSSRSIGALALGELCAELEAAGKRGDAAAVRDLAALVATELQRVGAAIDAMLADDGKVLAGQP